MNTDATIIESVTAVQQFDRSRCIKELSQLRQPKLDFTREFLDSLNVDDLRHVVAAAFIQAHKSRHTQ